MRVCAWNVRRAVQHRNDVWKYFMGISPDIALLQEVGSFPDSVGSRYSILQRRAYAGNGKSQTFSTAVLVRGSIDRKMRFSTPWDWVNEELPNFKGNLISAEVSLPSGRRLRVVSVYSPAWPIFDRQHLDEIDASEVKLRNNPDVWLTEIVWASLLHEDRKDPPWIVAGDFNSSVTFDTLWKGGPRGNQEFQDRMSGLDFVECLKLSQGRLTPTFRNPSNKQVIHQMDHLFVPKHMSSQLLFCTAGNADLVFNESLRDHLPIIADFQ